MSIISLLLSVQYSVTKIYFYEQGQGNLEERGREVAYQNMMISHQYFYALYTVISFSFDKYSVHSGNILHWRIFFI